MISALVDVMPSCHHFRNSVSFVLPQSDDVTLICGTDFQKDINVTDAFNAFQMYCTNIGRGEREFLQPTLCPGGLVFQAGGHPRSLLPPMYFRD